MMSCLLIVSDIRWCGRCAQNLSLYSAREGWSRYILCILVRYTTELGDTECVGCMVVIEEDLPPGWKLVGGFKVDLDSVSVYEEKRWWDKNLKGLDGAYRPRFIDRPIKRTNYRRS